MTLLQKIKESEGFRGMPYDDHLGNPTIGFGTLLPIDEQEAELLLQHRLAKMILHLHNEKPIVLKLNQARQDVLAEMAYQLGVNGVLKFKKMWKAIEDQNYSLASMEMIDSKWFSQTPNRATKLAEIMKRGK